MHFISIPAITHLLFSYRQLQIYIILFHVGHVYDCVYKGESCQM